MVENSNINALTLADCDNDNKKAHISFVVNVYF